MLDFYKINFLATQLQQFSPKYVFAISFFKTYGRRKLWLVDVVVGLLVCLMVKFEATGKKMIGCVRNSNKIA